MSEMKQQYLLSKKIGQYFTTFFAGGYLVETIFVHPEKWYMALSFTILSLFLTFADLIQKKTK